MQYKIHKILVVFFSLFFGWSELLLGEAGRAFTDFKVTRYVTDQAGLLDEETEETLEARLFRMAQANGPEILIISLNNLDGLSIEEAAIRLAEKLKPGDKVRDDGLILLIAKRERRVRIEVGQGLEGIIPDVVAGRIIDSIITPHFKSGEFNTGLVLATDELMGRFKAAGLNVPDDPFERDRQIKKNKSAFPPFLYIVILFWLLIFVLLRPFVPNRKFRSRLNSSHIGGGYRGGGFGGGGFGGGGGGFSGGGASGSW